MTNQKFDRESGKGIMMVLYRGRRIKVTGLNYIDIQNLEDICTPTSIELAHNQMDIEPIAFGAIFKPDREFANTFEIEVVVKARFDCDVKTEQNELIDNLSHYIKAENNGRLAHVLYLATVLAVDRLESIGLIVGSERIIELELRFDGKASDKKPRVLKEQKIQLSDLLDILEILDEAVSYTHLTLPTKA